MRLLPYILAAAALTAAPLTAKPLTAAETRQVDTIALDALKKSGVPAVSIAIVRDGAIAFAKAYGQQRPGVPATTNARYQIASISKQFTAAAILLLAEDGKLRLDDPVGQYLPGLTRANAVTIRQLLSHTSGYRDFWPQDFPFAAMEKPVTPTQILDRWAKTPLDFEPGARWQYSNTGYVAAGLIVEQLSGESLFAFLQHRVFARLGMNPVDQDIGITAADPLGYHRFALGPVREATPPGAGWLFAAGELAMSASDLARWDISVIDRSVMKPASYAAQQTDTLLADGRGTQYGLGVDVGSVAGHRRISHGGEAVGFLSENRIYPDDGMAIVVLDNADFAGVQSEIADSIEKMLFADSGDTTRASAVFAGLQAGKIDRAAFTANGNYFFTQQVLADYAASLGTLGTPKSIERLRSSLRGGLTVEVYRITYPARTLRLVLRAEPGANGRIEQFMVMPG